MEKKKYIKPLLTSEEFVPQEYIAACGDHGAEYIFHCDAGNGRICSVYYESNNIPGLQKDGRNPDICHSTWMKACTLTHKFPTTDVFKRGYITYGTDSKIVEDVYIWNGALNDNVHCTRDLDKEHWETTKS